MKTSTFLLLFLLQVISARADITYNPLSVSLKTGKPSYEEGERIDYIVTIKNNDPERTYPLITPGAANSGKKVIYLRVFDPATNLYVEHGMETRNINMLIKYIGINGLEQLGPGEEFSYTFYWNDDPRNAMNNVESHHSFGKPLFAGRYNFQAFYDPSDIPLGDSLYHFMHSTEDSQYTDRLNFLGPAMSPPLPVSITHKPSGNFAIEGNNYISTQDKREGYYEYYLDNVADSSQVYISICRGDDKSHHLEVRRHRYNNVEWIEHFPNGNISRHAKYREVGCPDVYYARQYLHTNEKILVEKTDMDATGSVRTSRYCEDGSIRTEEEYLMPGQIYKRVEYCYRNGKLVKKKKSTAKFHVPCLDVIEKTDG